MKIGSGGHFVNIDLRVCVSVGSVGLVGFVGLGGLGATGGFVGLVGGAMVGVVSKLGAGENVKNLKEHVCKRECLPCTFIRFVNLRVTYLPFPLPLAFPLPFAPFLLPLPLAPFLPLEPFRFPFPFL